MTAAVVPLAGVLLVFHLSADLRTPTSDARGLPIVSGRLVHPRVGDDLFRVGRLWID